MSKKNPADTHPSAQTLIRLSELAEKRKSPARTREAWSLIVSAASNPDFHAVYDFAIENELAVACEDTRELRGGSYPTWTNPIDGSEMVWIPAGKFLYGDEKKVAECAGFSMSKYPITNGQYETFLDDTGYEGEVYNRDDDDDTSESSEFLEHLSGTRKKGVENHPVTRVNLVEAARYCAWANCSLPTEWLWEKAARGTDGRRFPWGEELPSENNKLAQVMADDTAVVGKYDRVRSPYGVQELIGNVSEWCWPMDEKNAGQFPPMDFEDYSPPEQVPVRGICYLRNNSSRMKASHRRMLSPYRRNQWVGFRTAVFLPCRPL